MKKKVSVEDLVPGAFVCDFGRSWFNRPFILGKQLIKDEWMIERIRKYDITEVYIDTSRGRDIKKPPLTLADWQEAFSGNDWLREKLAVERSPWVPYEKELEKAKEIKSKAHLFVQELTESVKTGASFDIDIASEIVDEMVGSIARNRDALLSLISIQNKDEYLFNHSINVSVMMASFCKFQGMDTEKIHIYSTGALFHDLGKTQVPDEIILKPGAYTDEETKLVKMHPQYGKEILSKLDNVHPEMLEVVYDHHERMDGSGYPNGLKGHDISLGGRMVSILDVYDALTSDRPHQKASSPTEVLKYLFESSPEKFDLELLQKFIQSVGIYPVGSLVRLTSGFLAVVVESAGDNLLQPVVQLVYDLNKNRVIPHTRLDLSKDSGALHQIAGTESPDKWDVDIAACLKIQ